MINLRGHGHPACERGLRIETTPMAYLFGCRTVPPRANAGCGNEFPHPCDHQCFARNQKVCASGYYANVSAPSFLAGVSPRQATPPQREKRQKSESIRNSFNLISTAPKPTQHLPEPSFTLRRKQQRERLTYLAPSNFRVELSASV